MNLEQLNTDLLVIGNVGYLKEEGNFLNISIEEVINEITASNDFNQIVINSILPYYPNTDIITIEGGSLKAIFSK